MGIWQTNNDSFKVNIEQYFIGELKKKGCKFCWMKDNKEAMIAFNKNIEKKDKQDGQEDKPEDKQDGQKDKPEKKPEDKKDKILDHILEVITSDGIAVRGYILHIVNGWCSGTSLSDWFIIHPGEDL